MLVTCIDVFGRYLFNSPLTGSTELTEIAVGIVIFSVFPVVSWRNEHIVVDILDHLFSAKINMLRTIIINLALGVALAFLGQRIYVLGARANAYGEITEFLAIPAGLPILFFAVMCWLAALAVVTLGVYRAIKAYHIPEKSRALL